MSSAVGTGTGTGTGTPKHKPRLFPCALPPWLVWFVTGLFVAALASWVVTRSVQIRAPPRKTRLVLEDALPTLRSGDLLLLAGIGVVGRAQRFLLNSPVSHAALLYVEHEGTAAAVPWAFEATREDGVTLTPLWAWLADKDNRIFYRAARGGLDGAARRRAMQDFISGNVGRPYSYRFWVEATRDLPLALPMPFDAAGKDDARFCSELVVEGWLALRMLRADLQAAHVVMPRELMRERAVGDDDGPLALAWASGAGLGAVLSLETRLPPDAVVSRAAAATPDVARERLGARAARIAALLQSSVA